MKKRSFITAIVTAVIMSTLVGCGNKTESMSADDGTTAKAVTETVTEAVDAVEEAVKETEAPHEHSFIEEVTKEATCLETGERTLTCECGETKTETIEATGHDFSNYVSNEDATYEADGTETATCVCGETDTRVAEGSMLTYSFEDMDATKYANSTVNVRSLPTTDGEKLGGLSTNDEVKVTGKCNETGWYRIEYADGIAYVSDSYLVDNKVEVTTAPADTNTSNNNTQSTSNGYKIVYVGKSYAYVDAQVNSYDEARAIARTLGYDIWVPHVSDDNNAYVYTMACHIPYGADLGNISADYDTAILYFYNNGYTAGGIANVTDTKDGRLFIGEGCDWSIDIWVYHK